MNRIIANTLQYTASDSDIREAFPNTSFPENLDGIDLSGFGIFNVTPKAAPVFDSMTQCVVETAPVLNQGSWEQTWRVDALPEAMVAELFKEEMKRYEKALDDFLDSTAQGHKFADRKTFALRAGYPNYWHDLALAYAEWMDACNVHAYQVLQDVIDGKIQQPSVSEFIAGLPAFVA